LGTCTLFAKRTEIRLLALFTTHYKQGYVTTKETANNSNEEIFFQGKLKAARSEVTNLCVELPAKWSAADEFSAKFAEQQLQLQAAL
jgi:hypothetical protein